LLNVARSASQSRSRFVVVTATFRLLYALIVLGLDRRRVIHFDVTQNPTQDGFPAK
jgi:hypothetical protein